MRYENPVLMKELKSKVRLRQSRAVLIAVGATSLLFVTWIYWLAISYLLNETGRNSAHDAWTVGVCIHSLLIWAIGPALASNAITQEREQQTWEMLIFTPLTPLEILTGKLVARMLPMVALLVIGLPFMLFCYARAQLAPSLFFVTYFSFGLWSVVLVSISLFMSWAFRRTASAVAMSYVVLFVLLIGTALADQVMGSIAAGYQDTVLVWLNPVRLTEAVLEPASGDNTSVLVFSALTLAAAAAFLFWRMAARFRTFAVE